MPGAGLTKISIQPYTAGHAGHAGHIDTAIFLGTRVCGWVGILGEFSFLN